MAKEIGSMAMTRLSNNAHFAFVKLTIEHANECEAVKTNAATALAALTTAYNAEDTAIKIATKNLLTDDITAYDKARDKVYIGYKSIVNGYTYMSGDLGTAAKTLQQHVKTYNINTAAQLDTEAAAVYNFIQDLQSNYAEQVKTLGLDAVVTAMKEANDKVLAILGSRDADNATKETGAVKAARAKTDAAMETFIKTVNALALINGDTDYATFIDTTNEQINRYKRNVLNQSISSSSTDNNGGSSSSDNGGSSDSGSSTGGDSSSNVDEGIDM